jgi:hypothetical protein
VKVRSDVVIVGGESPVRPLRWFWLAVGRMSSCWSVSGSMPTESVVST